MNTTKDEEEGAARSTTSTTTTSHILYIDHAGHPAPLTDCYHATASRRLASLVDRYPSTMVSETDSAFCPQCLTVHDTTGSASSSHRTAPTCPKVTCQLCPVCLSVASVTVQNRLCYFRCGLCDWTSLECQLGIDFATDNEDDDDDDDRPSARPSSSSVDRLQVARAAEDLLQALLARRNNDALERHFQALTTHWEEERRQRQHKGGRRGPTSSSRSHHVFSDRLLGGRSAHDPVGGWSIAALEASLTEKKKGTGGGRATVSSIGEGFQVERLAFDDEDDEEGTYGDGNSDNIDFPGVDESLQTVPIASFQLQLLNGARPVYSRRELLPLPIRLRPRKSRRCRAELAEGRAGILLKPRLNPLEGDSSLRSGHGQWWKKDSSAVHVIPRVRVVGHVPVIGGKRIFLLQVSNPTLGPVRVRFAPSPYQGEPAWDDPIHRTEQLLSALSVDSFKGVYLDAQLRPDLVDGGCHPSEVVELHSAEDSLLGLGGGGGRGGTAALPPEVAAWRDTRVEHGWSSSTSSSSSSGSSSAVRLVAQRASTAWYEWIVADWKVGADNDESPERSVTAATAIPLRLEIEVGAGSWETSLIQPRENMADGEVDRVPLDLILVVGQ